MDFAALIREAKERERRLRPAPPPPRATPTGPRRRAWGRFGLRGVTLVPATGRYQGRVRVAGKLIHCGMSDTAEGAAAKVAAKLAEMGIAAEGRP